MKNEYSGVIALNIRSKSGLLTRSVHFLPTGIADDKQYLSLVGRVCPAFGIGIPGARQTACKVESVHEILVVIVAQ